MENVIELNIATLIVVLIYVLLLVVSYIGMRKPGFQPGMPVRSVEGLKTSKPNWLYKKKTIYRNDSRPYLIRYSIRFLTCKWFAVKVHQILISDHACLHDHPWAFATFLIKGGYVEHTTKGSFIRSRFSLLYRPAWYLHRLEIHQPVWSIVITFRKTREWGFLTESKGWVKWFNYTPKNTCE